MIAQNFKVSISYKLYANNDLVEEHDQDSPLTFITGLSPLFEKIENDIVSKNVGDDFSISLEANEMLPEYDPNGVVTINKSDLVTESITENDLNDIFIVGKQVPMSNSNGDTMLGTVQSVSDNTVVMDFNHPLSNKTIKFEGKILSAVEATNEEIVQAHLELAKYNEEFTDEDSDDYSGQPAVE